MILLAISTGHAPVHVLTLSREEVIAEVEACGDRKRSDSYLESVFALLEASVVDYVAVTNQ